MRTLVTRPSNRRPPKLEPGLISSAGPITPGKLAGTLIVSFQIIRQFCFQFLKFWFVKLFENFVADESQLGGLTSLLSSSLSPPTTPLNTSPPLPTAITTPAPPKKRFLLQTRAKHCGEETHSLSESDEAPDRNTKKNFNKNKKKYKNKKSSKFQKNKRNWKTKWNDSLSRKLCQESSRNGPAPWKSENGCTQQQLIEKIVDSSFDAQKQFQEFAVQRTLDYINTEHTYQKNPSRFLQQQKQLKGDKKDDCLSLPILTKGDGANRNIITPNLNNNTIILPETRHDEKNRLSYSFNDNNNLIIDYVEPNQRKLDQSSIQTNHDRMKTSKVDGYIPGGKKGCVEKLRKDCDNSKRLEDQKKPLRIAQDENEDYAEEDNEGDDYDDDDGDGDDGDHLYEDYQDGDNNEDEDDGNDGDDDGGDDEDEDEEEDDEQAEEEEENDRVDLSKNCDRNNAEFQSILGKVSREIVNMIKERGPHNAEDMAVARFNVRSRSETDSDGSWYEKSDGSQPESPGGRRSKRSCKGQRYEQFIKDSVSKKRSKNSNLYTEVGNGGKKRVENRSKKRKAETIEALQLNNERAYVEKITEFLHKEKEFADKSKVYPETNSHTSEDLIIKQGTKASDIIQLKLDLELKLKKQGDDKCSRRNKDSKTTVKKKPVSKVQMIKEKREMHVG